MRAGRQVEPDTSQQGTLKVGQSKGFALDDETDPFGLFDEQVRQEPTSTASLHLMHLHLRVPICTE
jgi:hypothetical protein